jgi:hypothetical protein
MTSGKTESVSFELELSGDGKTLTGSLQASKCGCRLNAALLKESEKG